MNSFYSRTFILCCLVAVIDRADQMLLPAVYFEVSKSLGLGPVMLATISACRGITESLSSLVSGPLSESFDRVHLIAFGCIVWAASTIAVGASTSITSLIISRMFNGFGLGFVTPPIFGIVSDSFSEEKRGMAFGCIGTSSNLGAALGSLLATSVAGAMVNGWRVAFYFIATLASVLAVMIILLGEDPRNSIQHIRLTQSDSIAHVSSRDLSIDRGVSKGKHTRVSHQTNNQLSIQKSSSLWKDMCSILKLRTFWILNIQGVFFEIPWYAMNFFTMWLELSGWSNLLSASIRLSFDIGMTFGVLIGGRVSDYSNIWDKNRGRILVSQFSVGIGIPLWLLILKVKYPHNSVGCFQLAVVVLLTGLLTNYGFPCKTAMLAEISPRANIRTLVYALSRAGEGTLAAATSPLVGVLAEQVFHFQTQQSESDDDDSTGGASNGDDSSSKAKSLSKAMAVSMAVPWALCVVVLYSAYWTFPKDRSKADERNSETSSVDLDLEQEVEEEEEEEEQQIEIELAVSRREEKYKTKNTKNMAACEKKNGSKSDYGRGNTELSNTFNPFHSNDEM